MKNSRGWYEKLEFAIFVKTLTVMQTTFRLHSHEISPAFLQSLKTLFAGQEIEITVKSIAELPIDEVTELAQFSLSDEWDSDEDQRWDELLK
ncbi:MAG: hypothetical protein KKG00_03605 [Bacteroidetes bacterium]|nr:hypothetical protein [Bacteroidota bacterium]